MNKAERIERAKVELQDAINKYGYSLEPEQVLSLLATLGAVWESEEQAFPTFGLYQNEIAPHLQRTLYEAGWRKVEK